MAVFQDKENKTKSGNSWYFSTYYNAIDGTRKKYKSKKYATKKEALENERVFLLSLTDKIKSKDMTFNDLFSEYVSFQKDKVKVSTYSSYGKLIRQLSVFGKIKISDFKIEHFNMWKNDISKKDYTTKYKNNIYKFLRSLLHYAEKYHDMNFNSVINKMTGFTNPNELKKEMNFWTYDEFKQFINEVKELKYKAIFETLYYCGLRKGEANALNWNDINFEDKTISVSKNITQKIKGEMYVILPPKTKSSIRVIPMPNVLVDDLKTLLNEYNKYSNFKKTWFVFGGVVPLKDSTLFKKKDDYCKLSGVKEIRIHDFRHSTASLLISNGASITLVAKYLGHSNIATTLNTYTHMFKTELNDIINIINNL